MTFPCGRTGQPFAGSIGSPPIAVALAPGTCAVCRDGSLARTIHADCHAFRAGPDAEEARRKDYSLVGRDTALAIDRGLAEADWYTSPVPRDVMRELLERRDGPAIRDTILYFTLIAASGCAT